MFKATWYSYNHLIANIGSRLLLTFVIVIFSSSYCYAQLIPFAFFKGNNSPGLSPLTLDWTLEYGNGGAGAYSGLSYTDVAIDSLGNFIAIGSISGIGVYGGSGHTGGTDSFIVKYNSSFVVQWVVQFGDDYQYTNLSNLTLDSSDNVYVSGWTTTPLNGQSQNGIYDYVVLKYNSSGTHQWTKQGGGNSYGGETYGTEIVVDASGNSFVVGSTTEDLNGETNSGGYDAFIVKYNSSGTLQWTKLLGNAGSRTGAYGVAVNSTGDIFISGQTDVGLNGQSQNGWDDYFLTKLNSSGTHQWTIQNGSAAGHCYYTKVAVDGSSNIYLTGTTSVALNGQSPVGYYDAFLIKYNSSGSHQWTVLTGAAGSSVDYSNFFLDSSANLYFVGGTYVGINGESMVGFYDGFVMKYNSSGTHQWTRHQGSPNSNSWSASVVTDGSANVYVAGATEGETFFGTNLSGLQSLVLTKYNSSGTYQSVYTYGELAGSLYVNDIAIDSSNNLYITGSTDIGLHGETLNGRYDVYVTKYNSSGVHQWTRQVGAANTGDFDSFGVATDSSGNVFITGQTGAALNGATQVGNGDIFLMKYNSSGVHQWTIQIGTAGGYSLGEALKVDASGNIFITGSTNAGLNGQTQTGSLDAFVMKYNSSGVHQWTTQFGAASSYTWGADIGLDGSGNIIVVGNTDGGIFGQSKVGNTDGFITMFNSSGTQQWTTQFGGSGGWLNTDNMVVTPSAIYLTGTTNIGFVGAPITGNYDAFLSKYDFSGTLIWNKLIGAPSGYSYGYGLGVDSSGYLYVSGSTNVGLNGESQNGETDSFLAKYSSNGVLQDVSQNGSSGFTVTGGYVAVDSSNNIYQTCTTQTGLNGQSFLGGDQDYCFFSYH